MEANLGIPRVAGTDFPPATGLVFHLGTNGYYAILLSGTAAGVAIRNPFDLIGVPFHALMSGAVTGGMSFMLVRKTFSPDTETRIVPWTKIVSGAAKKPRKLSVLYRRGRIDVLVDDQTASTVGDTTFPNGLMGLALFGHGRAVFHDLFVEELP